MEDILIAVIDAAAEALKDAIRGQFGWDLISGRCCFTNFFPMEGNMNGNATIDALNGD